MDDRLEERDLGTSGPAPGLPLRFRYPRRSRVPFLGFPGTSPARRPLSEAPHPTRGRGAMHQPSPGEASRHPALRLIGRPLAD